VRVVHGSAALGGPLERCVLTAGNFDGLHLGHQSIVRTVTSRAKALRGASAAYTFEPHPRRVLQPERPLHLLLTLEQKLEHFAAAGLDVVIVEPFDRSFAALPAERFVREVIHRRIAPVEMYVGYDFRYGRDRAGSMRTLTELGPHLGFAVTIIPEVKLGSRDVNSTRIRQLLAESRVEEARALLGRPYIVRGRVARGQQRGRGLGFPTLNLDPESELLPARGVYAGFAEFMDDGAPPKGSRFGAVTNVGLRPTFGGAEELRAEAHLFGFGADAYGRRVDLSFEHALRPERRFPGVAELQRQIQADADQARAKLGIE